MGLLQKLAEPELLAVSKPTPQSVVQPPPDTPSNLPPAMPCLDCCSPLAWLDPYGNLHCTGCDPPDLPAFVARRFVLTETADHLEWQPYASPGPSQAESHQAADTFEIDLGRGVERWESRTIEREGRPVHCMVRISPPSRLRHEEINPFVERI